MDTDIDRGPDAPGQNYRIVTARGGLGLATTALLRFDLDGWGPGEGIQRLIVDLAQVTSLDAAALGVLSAAHVRAEQGGGWLRLVHIRRPVVLLLRAAALDTRFPCYATVADARAGRVSVCQDCAGPLLTGVDRAQQGKGSPSGGRLAGRTAHGEPLPLHPGDTGRSSPTRH